MIYNYKIYINIQSDLKNDFVCNYLIPYLKENVKEEYFYARNIEVIPCINLYVKKPIDKEIAYEDGLKEILHKFINDKGRENLKENTTYVERRKDLSKMNGLKTKFQSVPDNLKVEFVRLEYIERHGEYTYDEEPEIYNDTFMKVQHIMEDSTLFIDQNPAQVMILLFGMFYFASMQLDNTGIGRGYMSFKSHLLGFLNYKKADVSEYNRHFEKFYKENKVAFMTLIDLFQNEEKLNSSTEPVIILIRRWKESFEIMYQRLYYIRRETKVSLIKAVRLSMAQKKFRGLSSFHEVVFSEENKEFFNTREFSAYRMLVNFVYLLLPAMGLNSRKRVQASYMLVNGLEEYEGNKGEVLC